MSAEESSFSIMVVDDQPDNLRLLEEMLQKKGYQVRSFPRGRMALASAAQRPPALVLLDVNMPEMNGYEVCERMIANEVLRQVPVIFLSALSDVADKVRAFQAGGVDYITKPFQIEEVHARVRTHLELYRLQREAQAHNAKLEALVEARTRELTEAYGRLRILDKAKSDFLTLISHELRTPLAGILGVGEILLAEPSASAEEQGLRAMFEQSQKRMLEVLNDADVLTRIEVEAEGFMVQALSLSNALRVATERTFAFAAYREVTFGPTPSLAVPVRGVSELLERALSALLETAVRFAARGESVRLACEPRAETVELVIDTSGLCVPQDALERFFGIQSIAEPLTAAGDLGLGPYMASRILALMGGAVTVHNREPAGIQLRVSLRTVR